MKRKIDYHSYKVTYHAELNATLHTSPNDIDLESMRAYLYGYTFTDDYAKGILPDEMSMVSWGKCYRHFQT